MAALLGMSSQNVERYESQIPSELLKKLRQIADDHEITDLDWEEGESSDEVPKKIDKKQTTIRVPKELHHNLKVGAAQSDMSADAFVLEAIRDKLKGVPIPDLKSYELILENTLQIIEKFDNILSAVDALRKGVTADGQRSPVQAEDEYDRTLRSLQSAQTKGPDDSIEGSGTSADPECGDREGAGTPKPMGKRHNPPTEKRRRS